MDYSVTWHQDLSRCDYFRLVDESRLFAVGWLEQGRPYKKGMVDAEVLSRLFEMARHPWQPVLVLGAHDCDLCEARDGPTTFVHESKQVEVGASNIFVPSSGRGVFVAPSLVLHYIRDHDYLPPDEFLDAVRNCPPMGSEAYIAAIRNAGGDGVTSMRRR